MISVDEALAHVFDLVTPLASETVPLRKAAGRILAENVTATRDQPPFRASIMDGYAVRDADLPGPLTVIGEAAAGHRFERRIEPGQAVRIFTGAPVPDGADRVIIQEDVTRDGGRIHLKDDADTKFYVREVGADFCIGTKIEAPRKLTAADVALIASMNAAEVVVARRPRVALLATGDELVMPGETPEPDQIIASNTFGLAAMIEAEGAIAQILPIARDTESSLEAALALTIGSDLLVTIGGASVGDHDLVGAVALKRGMDRSFYKVAMRPGKPLMAGILDGIPMIGLPGNPVSSMVCGHIFLRPALRALQGLNAQKIPQETANLAAALPQNGPREHYVRAILKDGTLTAADRQDSALLTVLASANALIVRAPNDPPKNAGEKVNFINL